MSGSQAKQGLEGRHRLPPTIMAIDEFVEVNLELIAADAVVGSDQPLLQVQKWRTGSEGRISVLKRRHGLERCHYRGHDGMSRWVGFGVIADNLIDMGRVLAAQA